MRNHPQPIAAATRGIVADLFHRNAAIYWADFLISLIVAYSATGGYLNASMFSMTQIVAYVIAGCGLYRVASFMHEIVHFRSKDMRGFAITWNLLGDVPLNVKTPDGLSGENAGGWV